jgi:hypothetical protein
MWLSFVGGIFDHLSHAGIPVARVMVNVSFSARSPYFNSKANFRASDS